MPKEPVVRRPPEEKLQTWIGLACKQVRERARVEPMQVALLANVKSDATIKRFEQGKHARVDLETTVAAYALTANVKDARSIFELALDLWHEQGAAPRLMPRDGGDLFDQAFDPPARTEPPRGRDQTDRATRRKRAGG